MSEGAALTVVVHPLPFLAEGLHTPLSLWALTTCAMSTLIVAGCDRMSFRPMPFLPVELLEPSLTLDSVGAGGLVPVPDPLPDPGLLDPVPGPLDPEPDPVVRAAETSVCAINAPHVEAAGSSPASPP